MTPGFDSTLALDRLGLLLLAVAVLFQGVFCWPEIGLGSFPVHDGTLHQALSRRVLEAVGAGENPVDCWVSFSSMGYPVWRSYQPLVHWLTATAMAVGGAFASSGAVFGFLTWLLLCLHPLAFFKASRMLGVGRFGAAVAALVCLAPVGLGNINAFGVGYGSYVWSGSGLTTQLWAIPLLVLAIAAVPSALRGHGRVRAILLIGATALCHLIFGFAAAVSAAALALLATALDEPDAGPRRLVRLAVLGAGAASLCAFVVIPALLDGAFVNHSTWEPTWKWDSHGAPTLVGALLHGELLDAGRLPILSVLLGASALLASVHWRDARARALLGLTVLWLLLAFGRTTWGALLPTILVNEHIHLHRLVAVFQACAVLLIGLGVDIGARSMAGRPRWAMAAAAALVLGLTPVLRERGDALRANASMGREHRLAVEAEQGDLDAALDALVAAMKRAPGRAFAGLAARWGRDFKVGSAPGYHALGVRGIDTASHLWHSMSIPSDGLLAIDDRSVDHLRRFGIRHVLSDGDEVPASGLAPAGRFGRFRLWTVPYSGYFGIEREPPTCHPAADAPQRLLCAKEWLAGPGRPAGRVLSERRDGAEHDALVELGAAATVVFRTSYHPAWTAWIDGVPAPTRSVVPGFLAVDVPAGEHDVRLRYRPGALKPALLVLGLLGLLGLGRAERSGALERFERRNGRRLTALLDRGRLGWSRLPAMGDPGPVLAVVALTVLATAPFWRGDLLSGHDATEYPTRLAQLHESWRHGIFLPVWTPDLGAGFGQPFFGFAAPLSLWIAKVLHLVGFGLAASLNGAIVIVSLIGAFGSYGLGRRIGGTSAGLVAAAAFLFSGYFQLELYVRGAAMEFSGLAILPLALLLLLRSLERAGAGRVVGASLGIAAVALSHNAVLLMAAPALALFVGFIALARRDLRTLGRGVAGGVGGLALSAWFWLPTLSEKRFTHVHRLLEEHTRWEGHFVYPHQLLASAWGYGLSVPGPDDGMSFQIGGLLSILAAVGLLTIARRGRGADPIPKAMVAAALTITALAILFTHRASASAWAALELLQYLQFPWRFLALVSVFLPLVAAASVALWPALDRRLPLGTGGPRWAALGPTLSVAALALLGMLQLAPAGTQTLDEADYSPALIASAGLTTTTFREFEPIWVDRAPTYQSSRLDVVAGAASVRTVRRTPTRQRFEVEATQPTRLQLATFYFPGWRVLVNGQPAELSWVDSGGLPQFDVPAGPSVVEARFLLTPIRKAARLVSLFAALLLAGWMLMERRGSEEGVVAPAPGRGTAELIVAAVIALAAALAIFVSDEPLPSASTDGVVTRAVHVKQAAEHAQAGRGELAEAEYRAALAIQPSADLWIEIGLIALNQGRIAEAADAFTEATELAPGSYAAWVDLGIARSRLGQHRGALEPFARALELQPDSLDARHNLGVTWRELGDPQRASHYLEPVVLRDPRRPRSWYELGLAREALGQSDAAREAFGRSLQLDPGNEAARQKLKALRPPADEPASAP